MIYYKQVYFSYDKLRDRYRVVWGKYMFAERYTLKAFCANAVRAEQSRAEQSRAEQSRAEQSRAEQLI